MFNIFRGFFSLYPFQVSVLCISLLCMNLIEGIGLGLLIPVFQKLIGASDASSRFIEWFDRMFFYIHLKPTFLNTLILLCVVFLIRCAVSLWGRHISTKISSDFQFEIKQKTYKKLLDARLDFFWAHRQGDLMNILTTEANRASSAFFQTAQWVSTLLSVFIYIGLAIFISGWLALVAVIVAIAVLSPLTLIARKARKYGDLTTELNEEIQHELLNVLGAIKVLKGASNEKDALRRFKVQNKLFRDVWYKIAFSANSINIYSQPIAVIILSFFIYAGVKLNVGTVEIMVFLLVLLRLIPTIAALQGLQHNVNSNMPGYERITSLLRELDNAGERQGGLKVNPLERKIEFKGISFEYTEGKRILNELSLSIPANKTTSIVGPSGAGKSTLVDLILGFYTPQKGKIRIDDQNLEASDLNSWRNQIGYVSQEVVLFNDSIKANISWGDENISDEEIVAAAKMAAAHEFILELKNGYDTVIGDRGVKISGGQRQRLALARALVKKPKILILDEATSSLDHHSELDIKRSIEVMNRSKQITIIIIAHRFTTVQESDQIFVLDQGRIVEQGNWEQLTSNQGGYVAQINSGKEEIN